ncbi:MAG: hypothetical protein EOM87_03325 [Clostridia bacterium]|nr:hypothetical protein [Clostridia bacterium]
MSTINFFRGPTADVSEVPIADGQIIFDTEKRTISMDYFNSRMIMGNTVSYIYPVIEANMWTTDMTVLVELANANTYNISLGVPNPTTVENIDNVRKARISISSVDSVGITLSCVELPVNTLDIALQLCSIVE